MRFFISYSSIFFYTLLICLLLLLVKSATTEEVVVHQLEQGVVDSKSAAVTQYRVCSAVVTDGSRGTLVVDVAPLYHLSGRENLTAVKTSTLVAVVNLLLVSKR